MRIAIVDDNEEDRKYLTKEITEIFSEKTKENPQITQLSSGEEFVKVLSVSEPGEFFPHYFYGYLYGRFNRCGDGKSN